MVEYASKSGIISVSQAITYHVEAEYHQHDNSQATSQTKRPSGFVPYLDSSEVNHSADFRVVYSLFI